MKYITKVKDLAFLAIIVFLLIIVNRNLSLIKQLKIDVEQTKNNLYQTNEVISQMQRQNAIDFQLKR